VLVLEGRIPAETVQELRKRGHEVEMNDDWSEGRLTAASRQDPWRTAAANPRGMQGYAAGLAGATLIRADHECIISER
jgi:gamma-glutamyltranspeptidase/glutathione hydrolase